MTPGFHVPRSYQLPVRAVHTVGPRMVALVLDAPQEFTGYPGQFVLVRATINDEPLGRHYTISSPDTEDTFEITVEYTPDSTLSHWLANRTPTDRVHVEGPLGRLYYDGSTPVVVIASGPGIGAAVGVADRALQHDQPATIVYHAPALAHEDRLAKLASRGATVLVSSHPTTGITDRVLDAGDVYVFGFREFIDPVRETIQATGRDPDDIAFENYGYRDHS